MGHSDASEGGMGGGDMRILTVMEQFGAGGTEHQLTYVLPELARRGHQLDVVDLFAPQGRREAGEALEHTLVQAGVGVFHLNLHHRLAAPEGAAKLARLIRRRGYDVVHAKLFYPEVYTALSAPLAPEPARVVSFHNLAYEYPMRMKRARAKVQSKLLKQSCQAFAAVSHAAADSYEGHLKLGQIDVIPNAVPADPLGPNASIDRGAILAPYGIEAHETVILLPARQVFEKGHRFLIDALVKLKLRGLRPRAVFVGNGPMMEDTRARILSAGLAEQIAFRAEEVGHQEMLALMGVADIVTLPSMFEGFPNAGAECMALEAPLVASAVGGLLDLVEDGKSGALFPVGDVAKLAEILEELLESPERRARFGVAGRQRVMTHFSVPRIADMWETFYTRALQAKNGPAV